MTVDPNCLGPVGHLGFPFRNDKAAFCVFFNFNLTSHGKEEVHLYSSVKVYRSFESLDLPHGCVFLSKTVDTLFPF